MKKISNYWIGLDLGSSSVKSVALSTTGEILARGRGVLDGGAISARPANDWVLASRQALRELALPLEEALGVGLSGLTPSLVLVDQNGKPLRDVLTWMDNRAQAEANSLEKEFGRTEKLLGMNLPWGSGYPPAQLKWVAKYEGNLRNRIHKAITVKDYIGLLLTGEMSSDVWSSKGVCRVDTASPADEMLESCGWLPKLCPEIREPFEPRGLTTFKGSKIFGLSQGLPVTVGWSDALCAMLALGVFQSPTAFALMGTSNIAGISTHTQHEIPGLLTIVPPITPLGLNYGPTQNGGSVLEWLSSITGQKIDFLLDESLKANGDIPNFVPFLNGERAPFWRDDLRAEIRGISTSTGLAELAAATILGIAGTLRSVIDATDDPYSKLVIGGKGVSHPAWNRAIENVFGVQAQFFDEDLSSLGAALLAAQQDGKYFVSESFQKVSELQTSSQPSWHFTYDSWRNTRDAILDRKEVSVL